MKASQIRTASDPNYSCYGNFFEHMWRPPDRDAMVAGGLVWSKSR
jgi:hypothetical protein